MYINKLSFISIGSIYWQHNTAYCRDNMYYGKPSKRKHCKKFSRLPYLSPLFLSLHLRLCIFTLMFKNLFIRFSPDFLFFNFFQGLYKVMKTNKQQILKDTQSINQSIYFIPLQHNTILPTDFLLYFKLFHTSVKDTTFCTHLYLSSLPYLENFQI